MVEITQQIVENSFEIAVLKKVISIIALAFAFSVYGCAASGRDTLTFDKESGLFISDETKCFFGSGGLSKGTAYGSAVYGVATISNSSYTKAVLTGECIHSGAKVTSLRQVTNLRTGQTIKFKNTGMSKSSAGLFLNDIQENDEIVVNFKYK